jgi:hypothetical protein
VIRSFSVGAGLTLCLCCAAVAQSIDTVRSLSIDFKRVYSEGTETDSVKGRLYYSSDGYLLVRTTEPVSQYMRVENNTMLLYYPDSRRAFRIEQSRPVIMPFVQSLLWSFNRKLNLERAGFRFDHTESAGDTSTEYWMAPRQFMKQLREIRVSLTGKKKIERIDTFDADGHELVSTSCGSHCETGGFLIPLSMTTRTSKGSLPVVEKIVFQKPLINRPDDIGSVFFSIPPDIQIKKIKL